jgi:GNAT superfamily N-acetyltransferase
VDDAALRERLWAGLVETLRLTGRAAGAESFETGGLVGAVVPDAPGSAILNAAAPLAPGGSGLPLAEASARYRRAGASKWGLWLDPDAAADEQRAAEEAGLVLDSITTQMGAVLAEMGLDAAHHPEPSWASADLAAVGRVNDRAYGYGDGRLERILGALPPDGLHVHAAAVPEHGADPAAAVVTFDRDANTLVWLVATVPEARRRGLGGAALRAALRAARDRGAETTTLWASSAGRSLYEALGYRPLGRVHLWELRS